MLQHMVWEKRYHSTAFDGGNGLHLQWGQSASGGGKFSSSLAYPPDPPKFCFAIAIVVQDSVQLKSIASFLAGFMLLFRLAY